MNLVFPAPASPTLPIAGESSRLPVRRIFCVGRNYAAHAKEMGLVADPTGFFFFTKFADTLCQSNTAIPYPPGTRNYHYEGELALAIGSGGCDIPEAQALDHVFGYACALDMTRRDLQLNARDKGRPWDAGKNFDFSAPIGTVHRAADAAFSLNEAVLQLEINGVVKQRSALNLMIFSPARIIHELSLLYTLEPGDIILTGTPEGVGAVVAGDCIRVSIDGLSPLEMTIAAR
jgi:fumarylpyruvate hydrolase